MVTDMAEMKTLTGGWSTVYRKTYVSYDAMLQLLLGTVSVVNKMKHVNVD